MAPGNPAEAARNDTKSDAEDPGLAIWYRTRRVVVTGGASFIGSHLCELLVGAGASVTVVDDLSSGRVENLSSVASEVRLIEGDVRSEAVVTQAMDGADIVFHLAARHGGRGYIETHPVDCTSNMALDHDVFEAAATAGVGRVVFASSACAYPTTLQSSEVDRLQLAEDQAGFDEQGKAFADGEYGWAKLMGELQLRAYCKQRDIDGTACRLFTAYGERMNESHAVVALIAKAFARLDPFPVWGNGRQTRNFTYVGDTVAALALAGARVSGFDTLNVGSSHHHTIDELLDVIFECVGWRPGSMHYELDKPTGVRSRASDNAKIRSLFGWEPATPLAEGVARTVEWYRTVADSRIGQLDELLMSR